MPGTRQGGITRSWLNALRAAAQEIELEGGCIVREGKPLDGYDGHTSIWRRLHGPIPKGMLVHHDCRIKACRNVDHMRLLTPVQHAAEHLPERPKIRNITPEGREAMRLARRKQQAKRWKQMTSHAESGGN